MSDAAPTTSPAVAQTMAGAARAFLDALDEGQRAQASFAFDDEDERRNWGYFPRDFHGLPLGAMDPAQQKLAHALVSSGLSLPAYARVTTIIALENVLDRIEGGVARRDPANYFVSVFGAPPGGGSASAQSQSTWGWRLEGHHVSLNFAVVDGASVASTPIFLGANPADGAGAVRPCAAEEDAARELLLALSAGQRARAVICDTAPPDIVLTNVPRVPDASLPGEHAPVRFLQRFFEGLTDEQRRALGYDRAAPLGLPASEMDASQRTLLGQLIEVYLGRLPDALSALERERVPEGDLWFAWAGEDRPRRPHYYRLQAKGRSSLLIEYDNTQNDANHVHAVWRDPDADFGADLLRRHVAGGH